MNDVLRKLGIEEVNSGGFCGEWLGGGDPLDSVSPIDGTTIAAVKQVTAEEYDQIVAHAHAAFLEWRAVPAPVRGQVVRELGNALREVKSELGALVTLEMGKILPEGEGEVQEMIDICDFAVGLSRQLYGMTTHSERPRHRMYEQWHPLGVVGVISAFNFPVAVWAWNSALAAVCGDSTLWKPSSQTPLTAIACTKIAERVCKANGVDPAIFSLLVGPGRTVGEKLLNDRKVPLISATGSCRMGYRVGRIVGERLGRTILELGGNNAIIVSEHADMKMVIPAILFGSVGTAGQRCTTTRRIIAHESVHDQLVDTLLAAYKQVRIGNPLAGGTLMGPLVKTGAVDDMMNAIKLLDEQGGKVLCGGERLSGDEYPGGCYVTPCIAAARNDYQIVQDETFAPILYIMKYGTLDEAIAMHNDVPQGLSSSIFTLNMREAEQFLAYCGSDCGIANVNIGTSGAEIGGAFGGEKETGGGRESGSDSWKAYMRRQTNTINWSTELPLAQGIKFDV
ncbi:MAG: L-piperidine-6-carboxylate dehydrogenase [Planctomycetota bacterium]|jgi:aldehyde dehydrogenase (NAD+)